MAFQAAFQLIPASRPFRLDLLVHVSPALKRTIYEFKNFSSPAFNCQSRPKYIFSRDMFSLYHFWAWFHGVIQSPSSLHLRFLPWIIIKLIESAYWPIYYCCNYCTSFTTTHDDHFHSTSIYVLEYHSPFFPIFLQGNMR